MELLKLFIELAKTAFPLPTLTDKAAVAAWISKNADAFAGIVVYLKSTLDPVAELTSLLDDLHSNRVGVGEEVGKWGDGEFLKKLIEMMITIAPYVIQILPLFLEPAPTPDPAPVNPEV